MDFFDLQDAARRRTNILVVYFVLAVFAIAISVYLVIVAIFYRESFGFYWDLGLFLTVVLSTLTIVGVGTLIRGLQLKQGGQVVAEMLGGSLADSLSKDINVKRLVNVVEEMALASGTPVPPVYILEDETGINAFAAGFSTGDAVIGVTRGCLDNLNREQLQGVIAHEFSHIINGDMRLNIRLMSVLAGILSIATIGYVLLRTAAFSSHRYRRRESRGGREAALLLGLGIALIVVGYVGVFFAKVIKSAVSRQREYLADASAVQFTRNPQGLAGALKVIGGLALGSKMISEHAEEASHMFFASGVTSLFSTIMSTHPNLTNRIKVLDPHFNGKFDEFQSSNNAVEEGVSSRLVSGEVKLATDSGKVLSSVGLPSSDHVSYAADILRNIPEDVSRAIHEPFGARSVIYCLLLDKNEVVCRRQLDYLKQHCDTATYSETLRVAKTLESIATELRLPIVDIAISALRQLSQNQYSAFREHINYMIEADNHINLFEYTLHHVVRRHLDSAFSDENANVKSIRSLATVRVECNVLLSALVQAGHATESDRPTVFQAGIEELFTNADSAQYVSEVSLAKVDEALDVLVAVAPKIKRCIVKACVVCVVYDQYITVSEAELLRAVADSLGCPIPPIIASDNRL
ncbi:MAG: hypothetical protein CL612_00125 [Anaerolineaceae bacterium]|nr:hypothetical protein [Anaerolineaceae bacterium]